VSETKTGLNSAHARNVKRVRLSIDKKTDFLAEEPSSALVLLTAILQVSMNRLEMGNVQE
jgi:hypothetical protein